MSAHLPPIILASASPRRSELLSSLGLDFAIIPSQAEEIHDETLSLQKLCEINAERKAMGVARDNPDALVIGADTLVALGGHIYGKPRSTEDARRILAELSGQEHEVVTGICLLHVSSGRKEVFSDRTGVKFKALSAGAIDEYLRAVHVLDKAGAYGIQERGDLLTEGISGSLSNVIGLPLEKLALALRHWGYSPRNR